MADEQQKQEYSSEIDEKLDILKKLDPESLRLLVGFKISKEDLQRLRAAKAHIEKFPDLSILHLDAHTDRRDEFEDNKFSHACTLRRIAELNDDIVSVGIRSLDISELQALDKNKVFYAEDIFHSMDWGEKVVKLLRPNVYITFDLDVFDPAIMPSTGTPEPGGLYWYAVLHLLKSVAEAKNIVGCDIVELSPTENKAPDFLAAKLVYKILSYKFQN